MTAGVGGAGQGIGGGTVRTDDGVQFADNGDIGAGRARLERSFHAGDRQAFPTRIPGFSQKFRNRGGGFCFLEAQFGGSFQLLGELHDLGGIVVDGSANLIFEFLQGQGDHSS